MSNKFNVVVVTDDGARALLAIKGKTVFCKRVAQREATEYNLKHNRPARICCDDTPVHELDAFVRGYLAAALWAGADYDGEPLDDGRDVDDIAVAAVEQAIADCADFRSANRVMLNRARKLHFKDGQFFDDTVDGLLGHDFLLTRNRHGAGYWDRGHGATGDALTEACKAYGEVNFYVGDDGKVHA